MKKYLLWKKSEEESVESSPRIGAQAPDTFLHLPTVSALSFVMMVVGACDGQIFAMVMVVLGTLAVVPVAGNVCAGVGGGGQSTPSSSFGLSVVADQRRLADRRRLSDDAGRNHRRHPVDVDQYRRRRH